MGLNYSEIDIETLKTLEGYRTTAIKIKEKEKAQLKQRGNNKQNNKDISFKDISHNNIDMFGNPLEFEAQVYTFVIFKKCKFGRKAVLAVEDMYHVQCNFWNVIFQDCVFQNIYFEASHFWGCEFINCTFSDFGVYFDKCVLGI